LPISVVNQVYTFLYSVVGGAVIAFIYDIFRIKRKAVKTKSLIIQLEDLLFWVIVSIVMLAVIYFSNEGEIRGFIFIGTVLGVILYVVLLSNIVMKVSLFILKIIFRILRAVWLVISFPFKIIIKILLIPFKLLIKVSGTGIKSARVIVRNKRTKTALWRRVRKNLKEKI
jgi:spore cortex biosynthesis protein YabQ